MGFGWKAMMKKPEKLKPTVLHVLVLTTFNTDPTTLHAVRLKVLFGKEAEQRLVEQDKQAGHLRRSGRDHLSKTLNDRLGGTFNAPKFTKSEVLKNFSRASLFAGTATSAS